MIDEDYMNLALVEALAAKKEGNPPFGAVIVCSGEVIVQAHSSEKTDSDVTAHAELKSISEACKKLKTLDLSTCELYASGEPCNMCASSILHARIKRIVIGSSRDDNPHLFRHREIGIDALVADSGYGPVVVRGVSKAEAIKLFKGVKL